MVVRLSRDIREGSSSVEECTQAAGTRSSTLMSSDLDVSLEILAEEVARIHCRDVIIS